MVVMKRKISSGKSISALRLEVEDKSRREFRSVVARIKKAKMGSSRIADGGSNTLPLWLSG
jgi:hypothetical protein